MKGIYLILVMVTIAIVLNQITSIKTIDAEQQRQLELMKVANGVMEILTGSEKCLAYKEIGQSGGEDVSLSTHRIIDYGKLQNFNVTYSGIEPECARDFNYRFRVKVEKFNQTREVKTEESPIPPAGDRDIVMIFDTSGSMCCLTNNICTCPGKLATARQAALKFLDCASETDRLAIIAFGDGQGTTDLCGIVEKAPLTFIGSANSSTRQFLEGQIMTMSAYFGTPLMKSLSKSVDIIKTQSWPNRTKMIIMMTDGRESCCDECATACTCSECGGTKCNPAPCFGKCSCLPTCKEKLCPFAESIVPEGVPVFAIGFDVDIQGQSELECVSNKTNGKYYFSDMDKLSKIFCEIAGGNKQKLDVENWYFGVENHSLGKALESSVSLSTAVSIRINETFTQPGQITIDVYDGTLEQFSGIIDNVCSTGNSFTGQIIFPYTTSIKSEGSNNYVCMNYEKGEFCVRLSCNKQIIFQTTPPGSYIIKANPENGKVVVRI
jgi:hypothetical protein